MAILELSMVTGAIVEISTEAVVKRLGRKEAIIRTLKHLKLESEPPADDFDAIYAYALVEYGVFKPEPILNFFRNEFVRVAFRQSFYKNDPSILEREAEGIIEWNEETGKLGRIDYDPRREFAAFTAVFNEIVNRTRSPAEVKRDQKLDDLHHRTSEILERLEKLGTLDDIRSELARLTQGYFIAPPQVTVIDLQAQQMREWFRTLGYSFESFETRGADYFEWLIDVPVRRRYDRILVRGVAGEAHLGHFVALRQSVDQYRVDEGWLVAARRVSQACRDEAAKPENHNILCYTFDELLDESADFSRYFDWLESEVKRRGIDTMYVPLAASKDEFDHITKRKVGQSRYDERNGWIDGYVDRWLDDPAKEHLSILGEFGTGKTWFALNYAWIALQRYRYAKERGLQRPRIPLVISLRDYAKAVSVESLLSEFFFRKHEIPLPSYSAFEQLNRMGRLLLIFDGFDEMAARVDRQKMINNFWELARVVVPRAKVILTCRTEHFPEAQEGRRLLSAELQASTSKLTGEPPQFEVMQLEMLNTEQIRQVLSFRAEQTVVQQIMSNTQLMDLARRPIMTELILDALPDIKAGKPVDLSRVYLYAVTRKMERDIKAERTFTSLADKLYFLCELSWEMLSTDQLSLNYRLFPDRIRRFFGPIVQEQKDLDHWHYDMLGQTMLIRDEDGNYEPAHRSVAEFFVAYKLSAEMGALLPDFVDVAREQSFVDFGRPSEDYTWSEYFYQQRGTPTKPISPLGGFESESLAHLTETIGSRRLGKTVLLFLAGMSMQKVLWDIVEKTRAQDFEKVKYLGGNAIGILKYAGAELELKDYSATVLAGADLSGADLHGANFTRTDLREANFDNAILDQAILIENNLTGAEIEEWGGVSSIAVHPRGGLIAIAIFDAAIKFWREEDWSQTQTLRGLPNAPMSIAYDPEGKFLACGHWDGSLVVWDTSSWKQLLRRSSGFPIYSVAFSPDKEFLSSGDILGNVEIWRVDKWSKVTSLHQHQGAAYCVRFSPDALSLASCGADGIIKIIKLDDWRCVEMKTAQSGYMKCLCWSPDSKKIVTGGQGGKVILWNLANGDAVGVLQTHLQDIMDIDWSTDGTFVASGGIDRSVYLWEINTQREPTKLHEYDDTVFAVRFTTDARCLISGSDDWTIKVWDREKNVIRSLAQSSWKGATFKDVVGMDALKASWLKTRIARPWETENLQLGDPTQLVAAQVTEMESEEQIDFEATSESKVVLPVGEPTEATDATFVDIVLKSALPVLAEFSTPWCGPSRQLDVILTELAADYRGRVVIARVNIDKAERAFRKYKIKGIPTMIIFKGGSPIDRFEGWLPKTYFESRLQYAMRESD